MKRANNKGRKRIGGFFRMARAIILLGLFIMAAQMSGFGLASDWQLVPEEETPLAGGRSPKAGKEQSREVDIIAPQRTLNSDLKIEADRLRRYLKQYRDAVDEVSKLLEAIGKSAEEVNQENRAKLGIHIVFQNDVVKLLKAPIQRIDEYRKLITSDARFAHKDPGQVAELRNRGDELIKNARKMCELAEKWAKSTNSRERKRLGDEFEALRRETVDKQDKLMKTFNEMFDLLRPIFRALADGEKEITTGTKGELRAKYAKLLTYVLDINERVGKLEDQLGDIKQNKFPTAESAAREVSRILGNNAALPGISDKERQDIIKEIGPTGTLESVKRKRRELWGGLGRYQNYRREYIKIKDSVGIGVVRAALRSGNVNTLPGSSDDEVSKQYYGTFKIIKEIKKTKSEIEERDALIDQEWRRSRDELRRLRGDCIDKWRKKKPVRVFKGSLTQDFSARIVKNRNSKCASIQASCPTNKFRPVTLKVNPETAKAVMQGKHVQVLRIFYGPPIGIRCKSDEKETWNMNCTMDYDAAKSTLSAKWDNSKVDGKISGKRAKIKVFNVYTMNTICGSVRFIWNLDIDLVELENPQGDDLSMPLQLNKLNSMPLPVGVGLER